MAVPEPEPGARNPPELTLTAPLTVPLPPSVPPLVTVAVPVPVAEPVVLFASSLPALIVTPPVNVLALVRTTVPTPALVRAKDPLITPPTVSVPAVVVTVLAAPRATAPVPRLSVLLPANVKFPPQVWALLLLSVIAAPLVLSIVPPLIAKVPVPIAFALLMLSWPAESVVPPVYVLTPDRVSVPDPAFVKTNAPLMIPPSVRLFALVVTVRAAISVTAPVPRLRALLPTNAKFPPHVWALLLLSVIAVPLVLSMLPPLMVSVPVPIALALLMSNSPVERVVPPA